MSAHQAGENAFSYGVMYERDDQEAVRLQSWPGTPGGRHHERATGGGCASPRVPTRASQSAGRRGFAIAIRGEGIPS